jgi:citrate synthase
MSNIYPGLEGVVFAETRLSHVDGQAGRLLLAGHPVEELAPRATFEEAAFLLQQGRLPDSQELASLQEDLEGRRSLPPITMRLLEEATAQGVPAMDALRLAVDSLVLALPAEKMPASPFPLEGLAVLARLPLLVAATYRLGRGERPLEPLSGESTAGLSTAAQLLYLLDGKQPSAERVRALDTYLVTVCDHSSNASTFTLRVIVSTRSDLLSALVGAIGALKGPLHGGAPGPALETVFEIGSAERAEKVLREKLARGERLMGFGHRVYKVYDPRARVLAQAAEALFAADADRELYALARHVEATALRLLEEHKPGRNLQTNVEFYTALLLHGLGLPTALFTPVFAIGRTAGWIAHGREQAAEGRLIRPSLKYVGP